MLCQKCLPAAQSARLGRDSAVKSALIKIIAGAFQRVAGAAEHLRASEQPAAAMNHAHDVNDVNDASAGMLIHPPESSEDHGDFDPADSLNGRNALLETKK